MSSLDHGRPLQERPTGPRSAARPGAGAEVPTPRRPRRTSTEKAEGERPRTAPTAARKRPSPTKRAVAVADPPDVTPGAEPASCAEPAPSAEPVPTTEVAPVAVAVDRARTPAAHSVLRTLRSARVPARRPAVLLAAALVGALSVGLFTAGGHEAVASAAGGGSRPVSVASVLGLSAKQSSAPSAAVDELRLMAASRAQRQAEQTAAAQAQAAADQAAIEATRPKAVDPAPGARLTSCFCMRWGTMHWGIDLAAPLGTPEYAAMDGVVVKAGPASGFGQAVYIQHANGDVTVYGHMEKILVTTGQVVHAGDRIALMGAEGEATGPHLHMEVHVGGIQGRKIDPIPWLAERGVRL